MSDSNEDRNLVARSRSGDLAAADLLLSRHRRFVHRVCLGMLRNVQDAEDVTQDVLLRSFARLDRYAGRSTFRSWIYRIAVRACLDHLGRRRPTLSLDDVAERADGQSPAPLGRLELFDALNHLRPLDRSVVTLCAVNGLTYAEIGTTLGRPEDWVRTRLHRARLRLRAELIDERRLPDGAEAWSVAPPIRAAAVQSASLHDMKGTA